MWNRQLKKINKQKTNKQKEFKMYEDIIFAEQEDLDKTNKMSPFVNYLQSISKLELKTHIEDWKILAFSLYLKTLLILKSFYPLPFSLLFLSLPFTHWFFPFLSLIWKENITEIMHSSIHTHEHHSIWSKGVWLKYHIHQSMKHLALYFEFWPYFCY